MIVVFISCQQKNQTREEPRIAKTVPSFFINKSDRRLTLVHDTMYLENKLFSGYCYELYLSGDTAALASYFNGVEEGYQEKWYEGGQPAEQRFYINGKKQGTHRGWWPDGKPKFSFTALDDEYNGEFREWYVTGLLGKQFNYVNGHEEGSQRLWWENGTVRANYVIRKGRKYGLIGLKTCINPYDSVYKK